MMYPFESSWLLSFFSAESLVTESSLCPNTRVDCTATDPWLRERGGVGAGTATSRCPLPAVPLPGALHCAGLPSPSPPPTVPETELTASLVGLPAHAARAAKDTFKLEKKKKHWGGSRPPPQLSPHCLPTPASSPSPQHGPISCCPHLSAQWDRAAGAHRAQGAFTGSPCLRWLLPGTDHEVSAC